jgi:hypothetical protein
MNRRGFRVIDFTTTLCLLFPEIFVNPSVLRFDYQQDSSDGGVILLKAAERCYGLIGGLSGCLRDQRQAGKVDHPLKDFLAQRVFSIAYGYPDANDAAHLGAAPVHKLLLDRDPATGLDLSSQPTLSRFENSVDCKHLCRLGEALAEHVIERHAQRLHGHYDSWCCLPVMGFISFNDEADQYLCAAVLRPGNVAAPLARWGYCAAC